MLGSNPSADSVALTDRGGMLRHPFLTKCRSSSLIGTGTKALNPGGAGAKPPPPGTAQYSLPITQPERSVFRLLCSETDRRARHQPLPPSEAGRPLIMHWFKNIYHKSATVLVP